MSKVTIIDDGKAYRLELEGSIAEALGLLEIAKEDILCRLRKDFTEEVVEKVVKNG